MVCFFDSSYEVNVLSDRVQAIVQIEGFPPDVRECLRLEVANVAIGKVVAEHVCRPLFCVRV